MTHPTTQATAIDTPLVLTPPDVVEAVPSTKVAGAVKLSDELKSKVETQLDAFMDGLMKGDPQSDEFKARLDSAFAIGRKEIAESTTLSNRFTSKNFVGAEDTPAYQAIANMRALFDELNPARQGDLFTPTKFLGIPVPFASKLNRYMRKYQSAGNQIAAIQGQIIEAKDEIAKDVAEMGVARQQVWAALEKLEAAAYFIRSLDERLTTQIATLKQGDPDRARAFEQEVLYYVRQNLGDILAAQALSINAYNVMGELRKTGRETMNGCDRVATLGTAALSVAVTLARATGNQIATQKMINESKNQIESLITQTGDALNTHVDMTTKFASEPILGVQTLQNMFNKTFEAMDKLEKFRSESLTAMQQNNNMIAQELSKARDRINNDQKASASVGAALTL
ncbi:MAG: toxic anion resistance protein [Burkholderiales bacterium]|nr:toxic anion resistance protein [Burkholderiales bacterium]